MTLTEIKKVLREEHHNAVELNGGEDLLPVQKFQVFEEVITALHAQHRITREQFIRWVNIY